MAFCLRADIWWSIIILTSLRQCGIIISIKDAADEKPRNFGNATIFDTNVILRGHIVISAW